MDSIIHDSQDLAGLLAIIGGLILIVIVTVDNALKSVAKTRVVLIAGSRSSPA